MVPFGWYYKRLWEEEYGSDWALDMCIDWYEEDGKKYNFWQDLGLFYSNFKHTLYALH